MDTKRPRSARSTSSPLSSAPDAPTPSPSQEIPPSSLQSASSSSTSASDLLARYSSSSDESSGEDYDPRCEDARLDQAFTKGRPRRKRARGALKRPREGKPNQDQVSPTTNMTTRPKRQKKAQLGTRARSAQVGLVEGADRKPESPPLEAERILARSKDIHPACFGKKKGYRYLVRWKGYGAKGDTWEMESWLGEVDRGLLEAFNAAEHDFAILDHRGLSPTEYFVKMGTTDPAIPPSKEYESLWLRPFDLHQIWGISKRTIQIKVQEYETGLLKRKQANGPRRIMRRNATPPERVILSIMYEGIYSIASPRAMFMVRWRGDDDDLQVKEEWFSVKKMDTVFGKHAGELAREAYYQSLVEIKDESLAKEKMRKRIVCGPGRDGLAVAGELVKVETVEQDVVAMSEYEQERLANIQKNKEMLRALGLKMED